MSLFAKPKAVLWPHAKSFDLYLSRPDNNVFTLDINLWSPLSPTDAAALKQLFADQKIDSLTILVPDDVVFTKSFMYDSEITTIDKAEVIGLAESFINFKIDPEYIDYNLIPASGKTLILAHIFDKNKITSLEQNLSQHNLISKSFKSVSESLAAVISRDFPGEYFLLFPNSMAEFTLILARGKQVYLTSMVKGPELELQKIINYSKLYFPAPTTKIFVPAGQDIKIKSTTALEQTPYDQAQIATTMGQPSNLPLPVLSAIMETSPVNTNPSPPSGGPSMENKKNILPFIAVFLITAALASFIIWFVLNRNSTTAGESPSVTDITPTLVEAPPTEIPTPTLPEISKTLKLQVLNATEINGQAALLKEKLTQLGFTSIAVGNSKEKLTENKLAVKAASPEVAAWFQSQLAGYFEVVPTADLPATSSYDAVFYIGTKLESVSAAVSPAAEAEATVAPTAKVTTRVTGTITPTRRPSGTVTPTPEL